MSAAAIRAERADVCAQETAPSPATPSPEERARTNALRVQMRVDDVRRWGALIADECDRLCVEAQTRTVGADVACGLMDCAADAVIDACSRVEAVRRALRAFDERRELNDAALRSAARREVA